MTDANNCVVIDSVKIFSIENPCILNIVINNIETTGPSQSDGAASVLVSGGVSPYTYQWSTGSTEPEIFDLSASIYIVTIEDSDGCVEVRTISVDVIGVFELPVGVNALKLYPNPVQNTLNILIDVQKNSPARFSIKNTNGQQVFIQSTQLNSGENLHSISVDHLAKGFYLLELTTNDGFISKPFLVK